MSALLPRRMVLGHPSLRLRAPQRPVFVPKRPKVSCCALFPKRQREEQQQPTEQRNVEEKPRAAPHLLSGAAALAALAACVPWLSAAGAATAADLDPVVESALAPQHTTTLLDWMLIGLLAYWVVRVVSYSMRPGQDQSGAGDAGPGHSAGSTGKGGQRRKAEEEEAGLTGLTHAHVRSYMELSDSHNPDVLQLRNRALATAASFSVGVAVKECQPRIRSLLRDLLAASAAGGDAHAPLPRPRTADNDPVAQLVWETVCELQRAHGGEPVARVWDSMSHGAHEEWVMGVVEVVAMRAAQEQIQNMVHVAREAAAGVPLDPASTTPGGGPASPGSAPRDGPKAGSGRDIRGGGAH